MRETAAAPPITIQQYLAFEAPNGFRDELIEGEIVLSRDPKALHQEVAHRICSLLTIRLEGSDFVARQRTNMRMPQDHSMPSPDVFVIDRERWRAAVSGDGYPLQSPQLVLEVVSRSNTKKNVARKTALYLKNGARAVWIVYPDKTIVQAQYKVDESAFFGPGDNLPLPALLPEASIPVADVFDLSCLT